MIFLWLDPPNAKKDAQDREYGCGPSVPASLIVCFFVGYGLLITAIVKAVIQ